MTDWHYPLLNMTGNNGIIDLLTYVNTVTGGVWWSVILLALIMISVLALMNRGFKGEYALLAGLGFGNILGTLLSIIGLVNPEFVITMMLFTGGIGLYIYLNKE